VRWFELARVVVDGRRAYGEPMIWCTSSIYYPIAHRYHTNLGWLESLLFSDFHDFGFSFEMLVGKKTSQVGSFALRCSSVARHQQQGPAESESVPYFVNALKLPFLHTIACVIGVGRRRSTSKPNNLWLRPLATTSGYDLYDLWTIVGLCGPF